MSAVIVLPAAAEKRTVGRRPDSSAAPATISRSRPLSGATVASSESASPRTMIRAHGLLCPAFRTSSEVRWSAGTVAIRSAPVTFWVKVPDSLVRVTPLSKASSWLVQSGAQYTQVGRSSPASFAMGSTVAQRRSTPLRSVMTGNRLERSAGMVRGCTGRLIVPVGPLIWIRMSSRSGMVTSSWVLLTNTKPRPLASNRPM